MRCIVARGESISPRVETICYYINARNVCIIAFHLSKSSCDVSVGTPVIEGLHSSACAISISGSCLFSVIEQTGQEPDRSVSDPARALAIYHSSIYSPVKFAWRIILPRVPFDEPRLRKTQPGYIDEWRGTAEKEQTFRPFFCDGERTPFRQICYSRTTDWLRADASK